MNVRMMRQDKHYNIEISFVINIKYICLCFQENTELKLQNQSLQHQLEEQERTVQLLQQQMVWSTDTLLIYS